MCSDTVFNCSSMAAFLAKLLVFARFLRRMTVLATSVWSFSGMRTFGCAVCPLLLSLSGQFGLELSFEFGLQLGFGGGQLGGERRILHGLLEVFFADGDVRVGSQPGEGRLELFQAGLCSRSPPGPGGRRFGCLLLEDRLLGR